jgi:hypothetical protein
MVNYYKERDKDNAQKLPEVSIHEILAVIKANTAELKDLKTAVWDLTKAIKEVRVVIR